MNISPLIVVLALTVAVTPSSAAPTPANAVATPSSGPFQEISFADALTQARQENKIVLIDFMTTWCGPCKMLDAITWHDPAVIALLKDKTIALKVDAEKNVGLATRYPVQAYPTVSLIRPDGTLIDSLVGYVDAKTFLANFNAALAGDTSLDRAREAVQKVKPGDLDAYVDARYKLGQELAYNGKDDDALAEFLWCYDDGMKKDTHYEGVRGSFLLGSLGSLARKYPPARAALEVRRDDARQKISADPSDVTALHDFRDLNHNLGQDQVTLSYFDQLPPGSPARAAIGHDIFDLLVTSRRYDDAVSAQPYAAYKVFFGRFIKSLADFPTQEAASMRDYFVQIAAQELEALAGANKPDDARDLLKMILAVDKSDKTLAVLREHLARAGRPELMTLSAPEAAARKSGT